MMKKLVFAMLISSACFAQKISINATNPTTGVRDIETIGTVNVPAHNDETVVANGIVFFSAGYHEVQGKTKKRGLYVFNLNVVHNDPRVGCLKQEDGKVLLILEDGSKIECSQISASDCDPVGFNVDFLLAPKGASMEEMKANFEKLQKVEIRKIHVVTSETVIKYSVKPSMRPVLQRHFGLVAESLLK